MIIFTKLWVITPLYSSSPFQDYFGIYLNNFTPFGEKHFSVLHLYHNIQASIPEHINRLRCLSVLKDILGYDLASVKIQISKVKATYTVVQYFGVLF